MNTIKVFVHPYSLNMEEQKLAFAYNLSLNVLGVDDNVLMAKTLFQLFCQISVEKIRRKNSLHFYAN